MVDLSEIQAAYYMVAATGVLVAAIFYLLNLRETTRNRKITQTTNLMQSFLSEDGQRRFIDVMSMEWKDFDDWLKKYDSHVNPENFAKRNSQFWIWEVLGFQYRKGMLDMETLYTIFGNGVSIGWMKFKPIIDEYRKTGEYSADMLRNWEYLANTMAKIQAERDPAYHGTRSYFKAGEWEKTFSGK